MKCGLLGRKLGHSYSPIIHSSLGNYSYGLFETEPEGLESFLRTGDFHGLNVTIPYKKAVIPYCTQLSDTAARIGAVNTIVRRPDGTLVGHNTDYFGFSYMLQRTGLQLSGKKVLVLGTGGASITVQEVLKELDAQIVVISRNGEYNYQNLHLHRDAAAIVNCTPVGMNPNCPDTPLSLETFDHLEGVLDLVYNPARTGILMEAEKRGLIAENGLWMLVAQAKESAEWFLGKKISNEIIEKIYHQLRNSAENIILIGMPGCGKSTVGRILAEKLHREFIDADAQIVEYAGKSIPEIFAEGGETLFRSIETQILSNICKKSGCVIATGGGCVTRPENYLLLHQNGTILWICRDLQALPVEGRPLSQKGSLQEMYDIRKPMYQQFADFSVLNNTSPEETADQIIATLAGGAK